MRCAAAAPPAARRHAGRGARRAWPARGSRARRACRRRWRRSRRRAGTASPRPGRRPSSRGPRSGSRRRTRTCAAVAGARRARARRWHRSSRRRRRGPRRPACRPRRGSAGPASARTVRADDASPRCAPARRARRRAGRSARPVGSPAPLRPSASARRMTPRAVPCQPGDVRDRDRDEELERARRERHGDGQPGDERPTRARKAAATTLVAIGGRAAPAAVAVRRLGRLHRRVGPRASRARAPRSIDVGRRHAPIVLVQAGARVPPPRGDAGPQRPEAEDGHHDRDAGAAEEDVDDVGRRRAPR